MAKTGQGRNANMFHFYEILERYSLKHFVFDEGQCSFLLRWLKLKNFTRDATDMDLVYEVLFQDFLYFEGMRYHPERLLLVYF